MFFQLIIRLIKSVDRIYHSALLFGIKLLLDETVGYPLIPALNHESQVKHRNGFVTRMVYVMIVLSVLYTLLYIVGTLQTVFIFKKDMGAYTQ
jgi:hypothetical protein